jgi:hypothetical protein
MESAMGKDMEGGTEIAEICTSWQSIGPWVEKKTSDMLLMVITYKGIKEKSRENENNDLRL